jgi:hypothetical protein
MARKWSRRKSLPKTERAAVSIVEGGDGSWSWSCCCCSEVESFGGEASWCHKEER